MKKCNFTYNHYESILKDALKNGFVITNFRDYEKVTNQKKVLILRHDVDINLENAIKMAKIEHKLGLKATYFIRIHGEFYFPGKRKNIAILKNIKKMGHDIGLHTEASALSKLWRSSLKEIFLAEKDYLEDILGNKIQSATEHADLGRPENFWQNHFFTKVKKESVGIRHYPQEKRFAKFEYFSDSLKKWKKGCICKNLDSYDKIQLLIHADWWER